MRAEIDRERQSIEEARVCVLLTLQLFVRVFLCLLELDVLAVPFAPQRQIVIADNRAKTRVGHEQLEHFFALRSFGNQIAHGNYAVVVREFNFVDQLHQLVVTTVNVSDYNCAARHPILPCIDPRVLAVYCIAEIQSTRLCALLVKIRLTFFLLPFDAVDVLAIAGEYLVAQLARAHARIDIHEVNNPSERLVLILAILFAELVVEPVTPKQPLQKRLPFIAVARLHRELHRTKHLKLFEVLKHRQRQQHKQRQDDRHVPTTNTRRQTDAETHQQNRDLFRVANVRAETNQRRSRENSERARRTVTDNHHHSTRNNGHQNLRLRHVRIAAAGRHAASRAKREQRREKRRECKAQQDPR